MLGACARRERLLIEVLIAWVFEVPFKGLGFTENIRSAPFTKPRLKLRLSSRHVHVTMITTPKHRPNAERIPEHEGIKVRIEKQDLR